MKTSTLRSYTCVHCTAAITPKVHSFSTSYYTLPLCVSCQQLLEPKIQNASELTIQLYAALRHRNIPAQLEKFDGFKTIDIAVPEAKINIEVDGHQHNTDSIQALEDLKRTFHFFKKGYFTLRIPNTLVRHHLGETVQYIARIVGECGESRKAS